MLTEEKKVKDETKNNEVIEVVVDASHDQPLNSESTALIPQTALLISLAEVSRIKAYAALASLAFGAFALGTNEFITLGFLPEISATFSISVATAGWTTDR